MALKAVVDNLDDVPEALREHYKQTDNGYELDVGDSIKEHSGAASLKSALEGEREKRRKAIEERDRYKATADQLPDDFDPDEYERLKANGDGGNDVQKKVEEARERERKKWERELTQVKEERDKLSQDYTATRTEVSLKDALNSIEVAPHLRRAAERLWSQDTTLDEDGNVVTKDGTPVGDAIKQWAESDEGKHFIAAPGNSGGGAGGGRGTGANTKDNPWSKESQNLTEQMRIQRADPEKAKRLKAEAGG